MDSPPDPLTLPTGLKIKLLMHNLGPPIYLVVSGGHIPKCWTLDDDKSTHIESTGYIEWFDEQPWEIWIPTKYKEVWENYLRKHYEQ